MNFYHVSDFVIRLKNASLANRKTFSSPYTKITKEIGNILVKNNFLESVKEEERNGKRMLVSKIAYDQRKTVFTDALVISKPSLRVYAKIATLPTSRRMGISILSTNKGVLTSSEAKKLGVGGEFLFRIW